MFYMEYFKKMSFINNIYTNLFTFFIPIAKNLMCKSQYTLTCHFMDKYKGFVDVLAASSIMSIISLNNASAQSMVADKEFDVYVVDYRNIRIQKFSDDGQFITKWGAKGDGNGEFAVPHGIAVDSSGNAYVVDMNNCNVQKFDKQGKFLLKFGSQGEDEGQFLHPHSIALDSSGNIYVVE
jgi:DNA-binding beta-propeller fold protein YncE